MKLIVLVTLLTIFALQAYSLEVILNPYESIDYDNIQVYDINAPDAPCSCDCTNYQNKHFNQDYLNW
jgi:hypothetical protein